MTQKRTDEQDLVNTLERLCDAWQSSMERNGRLSYARSQTYIYAVRQFIKWLKEGRKVGRLPRPPRS